MPLPMCSLGDLEDHVFEDFMQVNFILFLFIYIASFII